MMGDYGFKEAIKSTFDNQEDVRTLDTSGVGFPDMIDEDMLYVDKTLLIDDILRRSPRGAFLYTRPRRFGKTTNISMLEEFFDIGKKGTRCFDGLAISGPEFSRYDVHKNAYNVIHLDLKGAKSTTPESFMGKLANIMGRAYRDHLDELDLDSMVPGDAARYRRMMDGCATEAETLDSVRFLSEVLYRNNHRTSVILIDEYDAPALAGLNDASYMPIVESLSLFISNSVKSNRYMQMSVLTGVAQIAKQTLFSSANNIVVNDILSKTSDERFGFTEAEVKRILEEAKHPEKLEEVKEWYDGYRFGNAEVYNPYSIINYVSDDCERPKGYWVRTGMDVLLSDIITRLGESCTVKLHRLLKGESIVEEIDLDISFKDPIVTERSAFSIMAMAGYLNAVPEDDDLCRLSIPNREIRRHLEKLMRGIVNIDRDRYDEFCRAVMENDAERMRDILERILLDKSLFQLHHENVYGLMVTMILEGISEHYDVRVEAEDSIGRSDAVLRSKDGDRANIVFEFKRVRDEKDLVAGADAAMRQIHDRRYYAGMTGDVILIGLSFWKKFPFVRSEVINMERDWERLRPNASDGPRS